MALAIASIPAQADGFPDGPIEVINNSKPGGGSDIFLRFATENADAILGTEFIHLSKTGGVATNALKYVLGKEADGQTLFLVNAGTALTMMRGAVDLSRDDIIPLVRGTQEPEYLVVRAGRFDDAADFIAYAREHRIKQAGTKVGGLAHVNSLLLRKTIGIPDQVYVPFEKSGEIVINIANGNVDVALLNHGEFAAQLDQVEALAVMMPERVGNTPDIPTGHEVGIPLDIPNIRGIGVLAGTPEDVVQKLEAALLESMKADTFVEYLQGSGQGLSSVAGRDEFGKQFDAMYENYQSVAKDLLGG